MEITTATRGRLRELIAIELQLPVDEVRMGVSLRKDLGMDSVAALNILFAAEEEFEIHVPETELEGVDDVDGVFSLIERYRGVGGPAPGAS